MTSSLANKTQHETGTGLRGVGVECVFFTWVNFPAQRFINRTEQAEITSTLIP